MCPGILCKWRWHYKVVMSNSLSSVMLALGCNWFISSTVLSKGGGFSIYNKWIFISKALTVSPKFWLAERAKIFLFSIYQFIIEINPVMRKLIHNLDMYSWWFLVKPTLTSLLSSANSRISFFTSATKALGSYQSTSKGLSSTISFLLRVTNIWRISKLN